MNRRRAIFLDRDGTIIEDAGYLRDPAKIRLLPGVAGALQRVNASGWLAIVITNQSGIARGLLSLDDYRATERRLNELLADQGARLDAQYFCPHFPEVSSPCDCRKPGGLLYRQAAERFGIDLSESWWVGDSLRDVQPAGMLGGRGILLSGAASAAEAGAGRLARAPDLPSAIGLILS